MLSGRARERSGDGEDEPPYPPEFRREARLLRAGDRSLKQLAGLGCTEQTLGNWLRQDEADRGERSDILSSEQRARLRELERENRVLRQEREILEAGCGFLRQADRGAEVRFRFVVAERAQFPVSLLCKTIGVTAQGFSAWLGRSPSRRSVCDAALLERIGQIHRETNQAYGAPRAYLDVRDEGVRVGRKRIARLMRQAGLRGADGSRGGPRTTIREPAQASALDLVDRPFRRHAPNQ